MALSDSDLANKKLAIAVWRNQAKALTELDDQISAALKLITNKGWTSIADADLAEFGFTSAQLTAYVGLMTQFTRLMAGQAVTTTQGRAVADVVKAL